MTRNRRPTRWWLLLGLLLPLLLPAAVLAQGQGSGTMVINEFRVHGANSGTDEFVELYNRGAVPVSMGGWTVRNSTPAGTTSQRTVIPDGVVIPPGCYYLLANQHGYSGSVPADQSFHGAIGSQGGIALLDSKGTIVDQVGLSEGSAYREGTALPAMGGAINQSYTRTGGLDTDSNSFDFSYTTVPDPRNSASPCHATPVVLASHMALPSSGAVVVRWESIAEIDALGFNLYRDDSPTPLNSSLIPAFWGIDGGIYEWSDDSTPPLRVTHYWIEVVTAGGQRERVGPIPFMGGMSPTAITTSGVRSASSPGPLLWLLPLLGLALLAAYRRR